MEGGNSGHADDWAFLAYGLLVCVLTICVSYLVLRIWPKQHYPRLFAFLAGVATVSALYVLNVPGAGFGLGALAFLAYLALHIPDTVDALFQKDDVSKVKSSSSGSGPKTSPASAPAPSSTSTPFWPIAFGTFIGIVLSVSAVAALVIPPAYLGRWITTTEPLGPRIERALNPGDQWVALSTKEREASADLRKSLAELADVKKRLSDAETALSKAQDELGMASPNTVRGIRISTNNGSRHADGGIYIGVAVPLPSHGTCGVNVSSDKVDGTYESLGIGKAIPIASTKGKYRVVLTKLDSDTCTFDLVKD